MTFYVYFVEMKYKFDSNFGEVCSYGLIWYHASIGSNNEAMMTQFIVCICYLVSMF